MTRLERRYIPRIIYRTIFSLRPRGPIIPLTNSPGRLGGRRLGGRPACPSPRSRETEMTRDKNKQAPGAKPGLMEYLLLTLLLLVVVVTAWTLVDNGLLETMARLVD